MKVYETLNEKDAQTGLFYKEWEVPEGMPVANGLILNGPPKDLKFPRYYPEKGAWVEDKDSYIAEMTNRLTDSNKQIEDNNSRIAKLEASLLDLMEVIGGFE